MSRPLVPRGARVAVALGGNALVVPGVPPTVATQARAVRRAMAALMPLVRARCRLVLTHGNGFQVGNILIRVEEALGKAYPIPLEVCVAESQGELGYLIEQSLQNVLVEHRLRVPVVSVLTQVVVDPRDPAFARPTKPVGPAYGDAQARALRRQGFALVREPGRGWRKLVPSPRPLEIDDVEILGWLLRRGAIVIAAGGGGVPVVRTRGRLLHGVPAVVDKDLASAVLARAVGARHLLILTGEPCAYLRYRRDDQAPLRALTPAQARQHLADGEFPAGSMGPKIEAAAEFVERGGTSALITSAERLGAALAGRDGTVIRRRHGGRAPGRVPAKRTSR